MQIPSSSTRPAAGVDGGAATSRAAGAGHRREQAEWLYLSVAMLAVVGVGADGFMQWGAGRTPRLDWFDALYRALNLFALGAADLTAPLPAQLQLARFAAPLLTALTAIKTLFSVFEPELAALRIGGASGHVIVCGGGPLGAGLARDFIARGERVVVIERDALSPLLASCGEAGAVVLVGDAADPIVLRRAHVERARMVLITFSSDASSLDALALVRTLFLGEPVGWRERWLRWRAASGGAPAGLRCFVEVDEPRMGKVLRGIRETHPVRGTLEFHGFDLARDGARLALERFPPDRGTGTRPVVADLLVIGCGAMGQGLVVQAARIGHLADGMPLRVIVAERDGGRGAAALQQHWPGIGQVCGLKVFESAPGNPASLPASLVRELGRERAVGTVFVCLEETREAISCALSLLEIVADRSTPIVLYARDDSTEQSAAAALGRSPEVRGRLRTAGLLREYCKAETLLRERLDGLARAIHEEYVRKRIAEGHRADGDASLVSWRELAEDLKDSNRDQADHIAVKLRATSCRAVEAPGQPEPFEFTIEEVEVLAKMEHRRWVADRLLAGWNPGPVKDVARRVHPSLVSWEELDEPVRELDREAVRTIPMLMAKLGKAIRRN